MRQRKNSNTTFCSLIRLTTPTELAILRDQWLVPLRGDATLTQAAHAALNRLAQVVRNGVRLCVLGVCVFAFVASFDSKKIRRLMNC